VLNIGDISGKRFMVSGRPIPPDGDIITHLHRLYPEYAANIDEVFGFVPERLRLYSGRPPGWDNGLSDQQLARLRDRGIGFSLNLTNHLFRDEAYAEALPTLQRLHVEGNSITCTNDKLAQRLRNDFPKFKLKASVLKHLDTKAKLDAALKLFDYTIMPNHLSDNEEFLSSLENKSRIVPWAVVWCAYSCERLVCWPSASKQWMGVPNAAMSPTEARECREIRNSTSPMAFRLDLPKFADFTRFKLGMPSCNIKQVK
jgi:hypothetical protein